MPLTTTCVDLPYPERTDPPDVQADLQALAIATDAAICNISGKFVGEVFSMYVPPTNPYTPPPDALVLDGSTFDSATYPALFEFLGTTQLPDFRDRFLRHTGGAFPGNGQLGGSANVVVTEHTHTVSNHNHTMNHNHTASAANDSHNHTVEYESIVGVYGSNVSVMRPRNGGDTRTSSSDTHNHAITVNTRTANTGNKSLTTNATGGSGTNANLPPFVNVTFYIQAVA